MKGCKVTLLSCFLLFLFSTLLGANSPLVFKQDGTFKIVQFTDLHFGEAFFGDTRTNHIQRTILKAEMPDLVVMTGDTVSGYAFHPPISKTPWWTKEYHKAITPMQEMNIPWAYAIGNHDDQADANRTTIINYDMSLGLSRTKAGPDNIHGVSNFFLPVYENAQHAQEDAAPVVNLIFFDSTDNDCMGKKGWGCVYPDTIAYYKNTSKAIQQRYQKTIPAMSFYHIPNPEFMNVWNENNCTGTKDENVCCFSVNTGLLDAYLEVGDVFAAHCGHDHNNDFFGTYKGIRLSYGRKTGVGGYGPKHFHRGARVIELTLKKNGKTVQPSDELAHSRISLSDFEYNTWIRQEDGTIDYQKTTHLPSPSEQQKICCDALEGTPSNCLRYENQFRAHGHQH